jgi:hypothetical protein
VKQINRETVKLETEKQKGADLCRRGSLGVRFLCAVVLLAIATAAYAQADLSSRSITKGAAVEYLFPEQVSVPAGKPSDVALHFRIAPGLHINSHDPREEFLIPTTFSIPDGTGVKLQTANYPAGADFYLPLEPKDKLSVYTGEFIIQARLVAEPGNHLVEARLHYQACDKNACMPPKTITVPIDVIGQ